MDIPDSYKNFEKIVSYNELERSTKIMECCKCISMKKAGRRSSMKSHFHGFGGLEAYTNKRKRHFVRTNALLAIKEMMKLLHLGNKKINKMLKELEAHNLIYRSHQGLGKLNKIYVCDLLKADNSNWLPKQFKHRKGAAK